MELQTIVFSDNQESFSKLVQQNGQNNSMPINQLATLLPVLNALKDDHFSKFIAEVQDSTQFINLKIFARIFKLLKYGEGQVSIKFLNALNQQQEENLNLILEASGFKNKQFADSVLTLNKQPKEQPHVLDQQQIENAVVSKSCVVIKENSQQQYQTQQQEKAQQQEQQPQQKQKVNPFAQVKQGASVKIDENDLLSNDVVVKQQVDGQADGGDCSTKPKACKNCSCGRADLEKQNLSEDELMKQLEKGDIKSSCGNCYLGDAFRCASCPYKGLPAFQPGDKIKLDLGFSDNNLNQKAEEGISIKGGKVTLDI